MKIAVANNTAEVLVCSAGTVLTVIVNLVRKTKLLAYPQKNLVQSIHLVCL